MKTIATPSDLLKKVNAFKVSRLILTAVELRIFDHFTEEYTDSETVATLLHLDARATNRLLNALATTGLMNKKKGKFRNSEFSEQFLVSTAPKFMIGLDHTIGLWKNWSSLTSAVQTRNTGTGPGQDEMNERGQPWLEAFIAAMHARGIAQGRELASLLDLSATRTTLDVGGGSGAFTFAFMEQNPEIRGAIMDLPNVVPITIKYIEKKGASSKISTMKGNYLTDDFGTGYDLVLMSAIIHINSPEENRALIQKGAKALAEGGELVIMDHVMNRQRTRPPAGALFALNMLVSTSHGDTYTKGELREWMKEAGLKGIRLIKAASGLQAMVGKKQ